MDEENKDHIMPILGPTPETDNKKNLGKVLVPLLVLLVVAIGAYYFIPFYTLQKNSLPKVENKNALVASKSFEKAVEEKSKNTIPPISSSTSIQSSAIDSTLNFLLLDKATGKSFTENTYSDKTAGYTIKYSIVGSIDTTSQVFMDLLRKNNFQIIFGSRNTNTVSITAKNLIYRLEIIVVDETVEIKVQKI